MDSDSESDYEDIEVDEVFEDELSEEAELDYESEGNIEVIAGVFGNDF